jgi:hypothetical protein
VEVEQIVRVDAAVLADALDAFPDVVLGFLAAQKQRDTALDCAAEPVREARGDIDEQLRDDLGFATAPVSRHDRQVTAWNAGGCEKLLLLRLGAPPRFRRDRRIGGWLVACGDGRIRMVRVLWRLSTKRIERNHRRRLVGRPHFTRVAEILEYLERHCPIGRIQHQAASSVSSSASASSG